MDTHLFSSSEYSNCGKSVTKRNAYLFLSRNPSISAISSLRLPSVFLTISSLSAQNRIKSPGIASIAERRFFISSSSKYFVRIEYISPSSRYAIHAIPFAPYEIAFFVSFSISVLEKPAQPFALIARTTPPPSHTFLKTEKEQSLAISVRSTIGKSNRISGLSEPYLSIASVHVIRGKSYPISSPLQHLYICLNRFSRCSQMSSCSTNDISIST